MKPHTTFDYHLIDDVGGEIVGRVKTGEPLTPGTTVRGLRSEERWEITTLLGHCASARKSNNLERT